MLVGGFAEGSIKDIDASYPRDRPYKSSVYDYDCDSDLEDEGAETLAPEEVLTYQSSDEESKGQVPNSEYEESEAFVVKAQKTKAQGSLPGASNRTVPTVLDRHGLGGDSTSAEQGESRLVTSNTD